MGWSVSKVECFEKCQWQFKLRYVDYLKTLADYEADNPLVCGTALHETIEQGEQSAMTSYWSNFPIATDEGITELLKITELGKKAKAMLPVGEYEHKVSFYGFIGFIDLLVKKSNGDYDIYDFKYCSVSSRKRYIEESPQLHAYKYFLEGSEDKQVDGLYYVFVPKVELAQMENEDIVDYRWRIKEELDRAQIEIVKVEYDPKKVGKLVESKKEMESARKYEKNLSALCNWCEFQEFCLKGVSYMVLPKFERKASERKMLLKVWIYGAPYSGKTFLADKFPKPLLLNTDGNIRETTSPCIPIRDAVTMCGRVKQTKTAWEVFKEAVEELEKGSEFETIVVDLLEDIYESCRVYMYGKLNITHESDDSLRAWDKVRLEFLTTMRRLMNLDYNIVLISQEDSSRDLTRKSGDKVSTVSPNLTSKIAKKISGMVDLTARAIHDEDGYKLVFHTNETQFGGSRIALAVDSIHSDIKELFKVCGMELKAEDDANPIAVTKPVETNLYDNVDDDEEEGKETAPRLAESSAPVVEEATEEIAPVTRKVRRTR